MADTPMMRQYMDLKAKNTDCMLFFRLGDFYEMFGDDAVTASRELDLALTTRDRGKAAEDQTPMCGLPYHSCEAYIARLLAKGYKVAICEQLEDPATAKGLVDRDVIRIITPGTVTSDSMLDRSRSNYMAAVCLDGSGGAAAFADISTGEFALAFFDDRVNLRLIGEIAAYSPAEAILNSAAAASADMKTYISVAGFPAAEDDARFDYLACSARVCEQFGTASVDELGMDGASAAVSAAGALLSYLQDTQKSAPGSIKKLNFYTSGKYMELDAHTRRNLELTQTLRGGEKKGSLLWVLDKTRTPMGSRLLRARITKPLLSPAAISRRLNAVDELLRETITRGELFEAMRSISDIERLAGRLSLGTASGRDMRALSLSIAPIPEIKRLLAPMQGSALKELAGMDSLADVRELIDSALCDEPPFSLRDGGIMRDGYSAEVDELRALAGHGQDAVAALAERERARTGVKKLRVGYNRVFGYYIELPRAQAEAAPADYVRRQTLANCERYVTEELKALEEKITTAGEKLKTLEYELFCALRDKVSGRLDAIRASASAVAEADFFCALAEAAEKGGYSRPEVDMSGVIDIRDGRHPVVEVTRPDGLFVPNDTLMDGDNRRALLITGPNMAGKSTYMRQTALIALMAQMGSFVPAKSAHIGIIDRIFTRIGASDDLASGQSTFMVEMSETAAILKNATSRSLLILDEIGRGTSTFDGMAIARAVLEHCADKKKLGAKTMFATHYRELRDMEGMEPGVVNCSISAKKRGDDLIFLRRIVPGPADDSYGIEVAKLAGVPDTVVKRAKAVLGKLESGQAAVTYVVRPNPTFPAEQVSMGAMAAEAAAKRLRETDLNTLTPIEAMNLLFELKRGL